MDTKAAESPSVELQLSCDAPDLPAAKELRRWIGIAAAAAGQSLPKHAELSIRIVDENESRRLNRTYRGKNRPTNVLSFPANLEALPGLPAQAAGHLGDVVLCAPLIGSEAAEQGKSAHDHWVHLLVHGFLHLLGFDHQNSDEADTMESLEIRILTGQGLANPYEDRRLN